MPVFDEVVWTKPAPRHGAPDLSHIADQLRAKPDETAMIAEFPTRVASGSAEAARLRNAINNGRLGFDDPSGTFRAHTRTVTHDDGSKHVRVFAVFTIANSVSVNANELENR
ncbi:hypothetical protein ACU635_14090 [[Actinomadura] parvosata]|uniref:hypothetical protein n=1 Tax=[Actinomadura] parvosata TaxID=1955412 RepID=UPI00406CC564